MVLTQYAALFITVSATVLSVAYAEREFPLPAGSSASAAAIAPRCYRLVAEPKQGWDVSVPSVIRLTSESVPEPWERGFYRALYQSADSLPRYRYDQWGPVLWRPVGQDSLDVYFAGWPTSLRLRIPRADGQVVGRMRVSGDVGSIVPFNGSWHRIDWDPMFRIEATSIACGSAGK